MSSNIAKPAEAVSNHELSQGTEQQISSAPQSSHLVVVVEDENALREVVCLGLSRFCMSVVGVSTARDAQQVLTENTAKPLILVTDLVLQGEGGWSLARWARERLPQLPVILISGWIDESTVPPGLGENTAFLQKPFSITELLNCLQRVTAIATGETLGEAVS